jgi:two-component system nitrate/nitrite response regulator NarL
VIRVVIVGEMRLYREGVARVLARHPRIRVTGATDGSTKIQHVLAQGRTDIVLVEMAMPESVAVIRALAAAAPDVKVIALGLDEREPDVIACAEAGISGYVTRDASLDDLAETIESVARGEMPCSPGVAATLLRRVTALAAQQDVQPADVPLTRRELQILHLLDEGLSNKEIAERLFIEVATVKNHVHNILEKLNVQRRGEAAARARTSGLATAARTRPI